MPRINDELLNSVVYLYQTKEDAEQGKKAGGTGFLVGYPTSFDKNRSYLYAVTNRHVVEDAQATVIRINRADGGMDVLEIARSNWISHPLGDDVAACSVSPSQQNHKFSFFTIDWFVNQEVISKVHIGPGEDVFILGRFVNHEGKQRNCPSARFGNISMMPGDPIRQANGHDQLSFVIEAHSLGGYSGSPVFVYIPNRPHVYAAGTRNVWLIGVDWGHIIDWQPLIVQRPKKRHPEGWGIPINTGLIGVVPAWQLLDLLNEEEFVKQRKDAETHEIHTQQQSTAVFDVI